MTVIGLAIALLNNLLVATALLLLSPGADAGYPASTQDANSVFASAMRPAAFLSPMQQASTITPTLTVTKTTNGVYAPASPGPVLVVGSAVTWTYLISNTGSVSITLTAEDSIEGNLEVVCPALQSPLEPGIGITCVLSDGVATAGQYRNLVTVTGTNFLNPSLSTVVTDVSHYFGVNPQLTLSKSTNGESPTQSPGPYIPISSTVTWMYTLQNTGNVTLTALVLVDDKQGAVSTCAPYALASGLAPTQLTVCTKIGAAAAGQYTNTAVVSGTATLGNFAPVTATARSFYFGPQAQVLLTKFTNGQDVASPTGLYLRVGDPVTWTYRITNTSNVTLTLALTDVSTSGVRGVSNCAPGGLAPYTNTLCTLTGTVQAGAYTNTATITGTATVGDAQATATDSSFYFGVTTGISLTKYTNGQDVSSVPGPYLRVGEPVTWTYRITNTSNVTLTLALTDVSASGASGVSGCAPGGLAPGANTLCTLTGTVQANQFSNTATVTGTTTVGAGWQITMADSSYYYGIRPQVAISKTTNGEAPTQAPGPYVAPGSAVSWLYTVRNTGNVTLTGLTLFDDQEGALDCTPPLASGLAPDAQTICNKANLAHAGQYTNTATITGTTLLGGFTPITASVKSFYFGVTAGISLTKYTNGQVVASPTGLYLHVGEPVTWTYRLTNTSNTPLGSLTLTDDRQGAVVSCSPGLSSGLAAGASAVCAASGTAQAGQYINTATVTGATTLGTPRNVTATASSYYFGVRPGIALTKVTNDMAAPVAPGPYLPEGAQVMWSYRITNTSNAPLGSLALTDDQQGAITSCTPPLTNGLAPDASAICTASGVAQAGQYANTATVTGATTLGTPQSVQATAASHYFGVSPDAAVSKQVAPASADAGEVVTYTLVVTGPAAAQPVTLALTDTLPAALQGEAGSVVATLGAATLDPATHTLHWSYTTTAGRADTATITYRARLTTQCTTSLTNQARFFVAGVEAGQAAVTLALKSALKCDIHLPAVLKPAPIEQLPALVNGAFDASPASTGWTQLVNNIAGDLIYADGAPFAALSRPNYAWLGGARNQTNQLRQSLTAALPANYAATLQLCYRLESAETITGNDYVEIRAGEKTTPDAADNRQRIDLYAGAVTPGQQWKHAVVPLDALKGKTITIEFFSSLDGALNGNFLVDNVKLCVLVAVPGSNAPVCAAEEFCTAVTATEETRGPIVEKP